MTNSVCNYGQDSTRPLGPATDGTGMLTRVVSSGPSPDARRSSQSTSSCWSRRTFEQAPPQRASSGSAVGRVERRGEASGACRGSATGSISLLWRPWSPVGCGVRGRPDAIASPGSLQRQPPPERGSTPSPRPRCPDCHRATPHARGSTHRHPSATRAAPSRPARTGVNPGPCAGTPRLVGPPRTHGGQPGRTPAESTRTVSAPHARGSTVDDRVRDAGEQVRPARTGVNPPRRCAASHRRCPPRTHEGQPIHINCLLWPSSAAPHARRSTLKGCGREPGCPGPPAQIRTCALTHTAPTLGG